MCASCKRFTNPREREGWLNYRSCQPRRDRQRTKKFSGLPTRNRRRSMRSHLLGKQRDLSSCRRKLGHRKSNRQGRTLAAMLTEIITLLRRARGAIRSEVIPHKIVFSRIASTSSRRARPAYAPANHFSGKCPEKCSSDRNLGWDHHGKHCTQTNTAPEKLLVGPGNRPSKQQFGRPSRHTSGK